MVDGIKINELPLAMTPGLDFEFPAIRDNVTQKLTVQQVADLVTAIIIDGSPEALDTLNELAAALGDDANFATTVNTALAARLKRDGTTAMTGPLNLGGNDIQNAANLVGMVAAFPATSPPPGWLKLNGALLTRASYPALWAYAQSSGALVSEATWTASAWGSFSSGDGSTTFRLPDARGEFLRYFNDGHASKDVGRVIGSGQLDAFQGHNHSVLQTANTTGSNSLSKTGSDVFTSGTLVASPTTDFVNGTPRTASETRPRNVAWLACVKY
jgi:microcystin-dependent protein